MQIILSTYFSTIWSIPSLILKWWWIWTFQKIFLFNVLLPSYFFSTLLIVKAFLIDKVHVIIEREREGEKKMFLTVLHTMCGPVSCRHQYPAKKNSTSNNSSALFLNKIWTYPMTSRMSQVFKNTFSGLFGERIYNLRDKRVRHLFFLSAKIRHFTV